jgi:hypothetical protein
VKDGEVAEKSKESRNYHPHPNKSYPQWKYSRKMKKSFDLHH